MNARSNKRPQLSFDELQQLKWVLGGLVTLLGISTVVYMDVEAWTVMGVTALATLVTMVRPTLPARVPSVLHALAFPAIVLFFVVDLWLKTEILPAMVRLGILLLLYRNVTYRQRRDDLQIIVLGLFLVVVAGVLTVSLTFALHILVYTACSLALLLVVTLSDAMLGPTPAKPVPFGETPSWALHMNLRHLAARLREALDWRIVGLGAVLFVGVVGVSAVLFLAIPRFQLDSSMFLDRLISKKAKSGFSDTIRFGDVTDIQQDTSVALSVDVSDQTQIPASPYWRMLVLDVYENGTFRWSQTSRTYELERERSSAIINGHARPKRGELVQWTFYLESGISRYLPLLGPFDTLRFREPQNFQYGPRLALVALRDEPVTMLAYRVDGFEISASLPDPSFAREVSLHADSPQRRVSLHLRLPAFPRELDFTLLNRALADATGGEKMDAADFARRVSEWLKRHHAYSLAPNIPGTTGDPLIRWLTSREAGHCELFAGSFVLMARAAGFPARMVTGFRGGTWNGYSNNFTIRNADAHAWAEIFDVNTGAWLRTDPLAITLPGQAEEARGEAAVASRLDRSWKARLDSLRVFWYRRIVSFDQRSQVETFRAVKEASRKSGQMIRDAIAGAGESVRNWVAAPWDFRRVISLVGVAAVAALIVWVWREFGREWWRALRRGRRRGEDPVRREAGRWLMRLQLPREPSADEVLAKRELQRLRFGPRETWPEPQKTFRRARQMYRDSRRRERRRRA